MRVGFYWKQLKGRYSLQRKSQLALKYGMRWLANSKQLPLSLVRQKLSKFQKKQELLRALKSSCEELA